MPRGNDPTAGQDLFSQYGVHGNAEDLIRGHRARIDPAVTRAGLLPIDEDATAEAREDFDGTAGKFKLGEGETLLDVAVRGNALVGVVESAEGDIRKTVVGWNSKYQPPELTPAEQADRIAVAEQARVAEEVARLRAEADTRIAQVRADEEARVAAALAEHATGGNAGGGENGGGVADLNAEDAIKHVADLDAEALAAAKETEESGKKRTTVLSAIEAREKALAEEG